MRADLSRDVDLDAFDFELPAARIAQHPTAERDGGRLLMLDRATGAVEHSSIRNLPRALERGDLLIVNDTRVLPARLRGRKESGGSAEALLIGTAPGADNRYRALVRATGRLRTGQKFCFGPTAAPIDAELLELAEDGLVVLGFAPGISPYSVGETPLPPYIRRDGPEDADVERYQTVFARDPGSVAAPTAGLHLSEAVLAALSASGIERAEITLHVGPGTFRPLRAQDLATGRLHAEAYTLPAETAQAIARTRARGGRVVAVGTTTARVLETCADGQGGVTASHGETDLFLSPGADFRVVDALLTNFHLPRSSLLLLVAAFTGRDTILRTYAEAVRLEYRFYSYGDAMLIR